MAYATRHKSGYLPCLIGFHGFGGKSAAELMSHKAALVLYSFFDKRKSKALFCNDKKFVALL